MVKKSKTILIPYCFFELIGAFLNAVVFEPQLNWKGGLYNLLTVHCNIGANWFLPAFFIASCIFFLVQKYGNKEVGWLITAVGFVLAMMTPNNHYLLLLTRGLIGFGFIFLGYILKGFYASQKTYLVVLALLVTGFVAMINGYNDMWSCTFHNPVLYIIGAITGTYFVIGISKSISSKTIELIGKNTLPIMGTHQIVISFAHKYFNIGSSVVWILALIAAIAIFEVIILSVFNKYFPALIGKRTN